MKFPEDQCLRSVFCNGFIFSYKGIFAFAKCSVSTKLIMLSRWTFCFFYLQSIAERLGGYNEHNARAQLRVLLENQGGAPTGADPVSTRLAELKGQAPESALKTRPPTRAKTGHKVTSSKDILQGQLRELQTRVDNANSELVKVQ